MKNKIIAKIFVYLIVSLVLIMPMNLAYAIDAPTTTESKESVRNACSITPPVNVRDSLILSIVTLCIPGILEKTMEWKEIKCEMAVCSYEAVKNNLDPTFCTKQGSYKTCKYVMGEIFAIPPLAILDYLRDMVAGILANPVGIMYGVMAKLARDYAKSCGENNSCSALVPATIFLAITDTLAVYQTFMDMFQGGFKGLFNFGSDSKCNELSKIRDDIEGLVENG